MAIEFEDDVERFERERRKSRENKGAPFFLGLKDGQRAKVRFLMEHSYAEKATLKFHQLYDKGQWEANCVCAEEIGATCEVCARAVRENNWKLKAKQHTFLPIYVHSIVKRENGAWVPLVYTQDGQEKPVSGLRFLDEKTKTSPVLDALYLHYTESADAIKDRSICTLDFVIARNGAGLDTKYQVSPLARKPEQVPTEIPMLTPDEVKALVIDQRPPVVVVGDEAAPAVSSTDFDLPADIESDTPF